MSEKFDKKTVLILSLLILLYIMSIFLIIKVSENLNAENIASNDSETNNDHSFIVDFQYKEDTHLIRTKCIGAYVGNSSVICTASCFKPHRDEDLIAVIGFDNNQRTIRIPEHQTHYDYTKSNKSDRDIMYLKLEENPKNQPIKLENNENHNLSFYTSGSYKLYRIRIDSNYKPEKVIVSNEEVKDCGHVIYCLAIKDTEDRSESLLVAQRSEEYLLLGLQQKHNIQNNLIYFTKVPLFVEWIERKM